MRHKSKNKTRPLFTLSLEMTRLVNETRLLLVPCVNSDIYGIHPEDENGLQNLHTKFQLYTYCSFFGYRNQKWFYQQNSRNIITFLSISIANINPIAQSISKPLQSLGT